jgi:polyhydroxyalkanoate synthase subunit PhaC
MRREPVPAPNEIPPVPLPPIDESVGSESFRAIDRMREALTAQWTAGLSPASLALASFDWSIHLASAPGKQMELLNKAARKTGRLIAHCLTAVTKPNTPPCIEPLPGDHRFRAKEWRERPYNFLTQAFLLNQQWWHNVTHEVPGVAPHHENHSRGATSVELSFRRFLRSRPALLEDLFRLFSGVRKLTP